MILILIMHALYGAAMPINKMLLAYTTPFFFIAIRMLIAGSILLLISYHKGYTQKLSTMHQSWCMLAQITFFGFYLTYIFRFWGLSQISSGKAAFFFNTSPFITALYAYILDKQSLNKMQWAGLIISFLGMIPILITSCSQEKSLGQLLMFSWAELSVLSSVALHCYGWTMIGKLSKQENYSPILINGITLTAGGLLALATALCTESISYIPHVSYFLGWLMMAILLNNLISHNIYGYLLQHHYSPTFLSFTNFLGPLFSAFYGWLLLHETITWHFLCSNIIILFGLYLFYKEEMSVTQNAIRSVVK